MKINCARPIPIKVKIDRDIFFANHELAILYNTPLNMVIVAPKKIKKNVAIISMHQIDVLQHQVLVGVRCSALN